MRGFTSLRNVAPLLTRNDVSNILLLRCRLTTTTAARAATVTHGCEQTEIVVMPRRQNHSARTGGTAGERQRASSHRWRELRRVSKGKNRGSREMPPSQVVFPLGNGLSVKIPRDPSIWKSDESFICHSTQEDWTSQGGSKTSADDDKSPQGRTTDTCESLPLSGAVTALQLSEACGNPSVLSTISSLKSNKKLLQTLEAWPALLQRLQSDSLPLLLRHAGDTWPAVGSITMAFQSLTEVLEFVDQISRSSGLRAEKLFPASLVAALWGALPSIHEHIKSVFLRTSPGCRGADDKDGVPDGSGECEVALHQSYGSAAPAIRAFKVLRRALAIRARDVDDLLPPSLLTHTLLSMERCGALSDDIIGPIGTRLLERYGSSSAIRSGPQRVAVNHQLSTRFTATATSPDELPFSHEDSVRFACLLGRLQVVDHFQLHQLMHTVLLPSVIPALQINPPNVRQLFELTACYARYAVSGCAVSQLTDLWMPYLSRMDLKQCTELLNVMCPSRRRTSSRKQSVPAKPCPTPVTGAEEDYFPLVDCILQRAAWLCAHEPRFVNRIDAEAKATAVAAVSWGPTAPTYLTQFMCSLARVNAPRWVEVYLVVASTIESQLDRFTITDIVSIARAIIHRGSNMPYHALHGKVARRLLEDEGALTDLKTAGTALVSAALMLPVPDANTARYRKFPRGLLDAPACLGGCKASLDVGNSTEEQKLALTVFRRHGTRLGLCSFVAGMCAAPLEELPRRSQERIIVHFTAIASAIDVTWLVKGIAALTSKIPDAVDPLSVQRWFSRFTAVDVVRQLDLEHSAVLLNVLADGDLGRESALAKRAITARVARLLLRDDISPRSLVTIALALHRADVFFPHLYSRICRVLLSNVKKAPLNDLLPAFHVTADEFTRCKYHGGGPFRDVWELLRTRLMDDAAMSLTSEDVVVALNGLSALDVGDYPIFSVLLHRLWVVYREVEFQRHDNGRVSCSACTTPTPAQWADDMLSGCTPSALAVLACSLTHMSDGETVDTLMPWVLLHLRQVINDLFPIDLLHLMPALLANFSSASLPTESSSKITPWLSVGANCSLLHAVYDACRGLFLKMYGETPKTNGEEAGELNREEWTPEVRASVSSVPHCHFAEILIGLCRAGLKDEAVVMACLPRTTPRCCTALPIGELVDLTMALCFHLHSSSQEMIWCDISKEENGEKDATGVEVDVKSPRKENESVEGEKRAASHGAEAQAVTMSQRYLPPALNALWERVEELSLTQIDALVRCLKHYYGERVDADFLIRLQSHRAVVERVKLSQHQQDAERPKRTDEEVTTAQREQVMKQQESMNEEPKTELTAEDLFMC